MPFRCIHQLDQQFLIDIEEPALGMMRLRHWCSVCELVLEHRFNSLEQIVRAGDPLANYLFENVPTIWKRSLLQRPSN